MCKQNQSNVDNFARMNSSLSFARRKIFSWKSFVMSQMKENTYIYIW